METINDLQTTMEHMKSQSDSIESVECQVGNISLNDGDEITDKPNSPDIPLNEKNASDLTKPVFEWQNITDEFFEAVKELSLGELMHHSVFGLFEAMSAIEMMDPKMDAGMLCNKKSAVPLTFETAVSSNQLKLDNFTNAELIGILDGIYACLVSWLEGHSLAQTLFTCLYLHQPYSIENSALKAFCFAMHKIKEIVRNFIFMASVFEEEDFELRDFEYSLHPDVTYNRACFMLKEAEDELIANIKPDESDECRQDILAIINRLKLLRLYLQSLTSLYPANASGAAPIEIEMNEIERILEKALELMPQIKLTIASGTQPEDGSESPNPMGFSPMVNQRSLPPTFPRYTKIKDRSLSTTFIENLIQRTKLACKIVHCTNYQSALNFFMDYSIQSGSCILSRSILQCLYIPRGGAAVFGTTSISDVLKDSVKAFIAPPALVSNRRAHKRPQLKTFVDEFFNQQNTYPFIHFIQVCGYNRARQRDGLVRLLEDFAHLQFEAERIDACIYSLDVKDLIVPRPDFSTWVLYHTLRAMSMYLISGLELELYSVHEYFYIFWYLSEYLYNWIVSALTRAECLSELAKPKEGKNKNIKRELMFSQALKSMFGGYFKALAGFTREDRIKQPLPIFDNERVRFHHRFVAFNCLSAPRPTDYVRFKTMRAILLKCAANDLYSEAARNFQQARAVFEQIPNPDTEIHDMIHVAKINFVVMNLLANGHKKDSKQSPDFDFKIHRYLPTIKQQ